MRSNVNIDITHKPKRLQRDNLIQAGTAVIEQSDEATAAMQAMSCIPLHNITLERAVQYYEANATGEYATLYSTTAKWLRQLIAIGKTATLKAERELAALESEGVTDEVKTDKPE